VVAVVVVICISSAITENKPAAKNGFTFQMEMKLSIFLCRKAKSNLIVNCLVSFMTWLGGWVGLLVTLQRRFPLFAVDLMRVRCAT